MPRRLRIKFRGNFALQLEKGTFTTSGKAVALDYRQEAAEESERVQLGTAETGWQFASAALNGLEMEWTTPTNTLGGVWLDALGVQNGTNNIASTPVPVGSISAVIDISNIGGDVFLKGIEPGSFWGTWTVTIDGASANAFWLAQSNLRTGVAMGAGSGSTSNPFIVKNPNRGSLLLLQWTTQLTASRTITANLAAGPLIPEYPFPSNPGGSAPNIYECDMVDLATLQACFSTGESVMATDFLVYNKGSFGIDPDNGLRYARFCIPQGFRLGISWWKEMPPGLTEAWFQYTGSMEDSVWGGIHPQEACKTGGSPTEEVPWIGSGAHHWAWRPLHFGKSAANPNVFGFGELRESYNTVPQNFVKNACYRANRWYVFDTYIKLNTINQSTGLGNFDGEGRMYINKNLIHTVSNWRWRNSALDSQGNPRDIHAHYFNYYHGGDEFEPIADMFYRLGRIRASTQEIALPPEFVSSFPTWRQGLAVNQVATIAGTEGTGVIPVNSHALHWNGFAITDDGRVVGTALGGHNSSTDLNGQNKSFMIDLSVDDPGPWVEVHAGTSAANSPDWNSSEPGGALNAYYTAKPHRIHYDADAGDVPIRPPCQSYFALQYVKGAHCNDGQERILNIGLRNPRASLGIHSRRQVDGFRLTDFRWDEPEIDTTPYPFAGNGTKWADYPPRDGFSTNTNGVQIPSICTDHRNGKIYYSSIYELLIMNPQATTNQWSYGIAANGNAGIYTHSGSGWAGSQGRGMVVDTIRERLVIVDPTGPNPGTGMRLAWFPLAGGQIQFITTSGITIGARSRFINFDCGFTHDRDNDLYWLLLGSDGASAIDYWYSINPLTGVATLVHQTAAGSGGPGRIMSSFKWIDALGGIVHAQGGNTAALAEEKPVQFLPTRSSP
jgi:hypothetical protein